MLLERAVLAVSDVDHISRIRILLVRYKFDVLLNLIV
jgi:hypothetical protein